MHQLRRLVSIGVLFFALTMVVLAVPALLVVALVADLVTGWRRIRWTRLLALVVGVLTVEALGVVMAGALWVAAGFGTRNASARAQLQNFRLEAWWVRSLLAVCRRTVRMNMVIDGLEHLTDGGVVVIARHTSLGDALLPADLCANQARLQLRYVLKRSLRWAPCIDIVGHRLPNHFVNRSPDDNIEIRALEDLACGLDARSAVVIFPEGTFHTPERAAKVVARLRESRPDIAQRAADLKHLLPPRPGGTFALLDGAPHADVVVIAHVGFERFSSIARIVRSVPFSSPIQVVLWRVPRVEIPAEPGPRLDWLYNEWHRIDEWCEVRTGPSEISADV